MNKRDSRRPQVKKGEKGKENPKSPEIRKNREKTTLRFICPTCLLPLYFEIAKIEPVLGALLRCDNCGDISHIPGALRGEGETAGVVIRGSVSISIPELHDWYSAHPSFKRQLEIDDVEIFGNYGFWLFCEKCEHGYHGTLLQSLIMTKDLGINLVVLHNRGSERDMKGLTEGRCPSCGDTQLLAIMVDIPEYVLKAFGPKVRSDPGQILAEYMMQSNITPKKSGCLTAIVLASLILFCGILINGILLGAL